METQDKNKEQDCGDTPPNDVRFENELLKLKLQAERGASFHNVNEELPPEIEAEFLKSIIRFEESFDNAKEITIYEKVGRPEFKPVELLNEQETENELKKMMDLLHSHNIGLDVIGQYQPSVIYKFITEELFQEKTIEIDIPGYINAFIYEEFHPNHRLDIQDTAQRFFDHWFNKEFNECSIEFAHQSVTNSGETFTREEIISKLRHCLESYHSFDDIRFAEPIISFEWNEEDVKGLGHAEGAFSYNARLENGEYIHISGPFKLYMINEFGLWQIFYFVFPGFAW
ncbi:MAG TPA: hypothetical protein VFI06_03680 [Chitinophagaceae bacterium]|nr:hypothetical protein [Chitinophagaceae bacterium]